MQWVKTKYWLVILCCIYPKILRILTHFDYDVSDMRKKIIFARELEVDLELFKILLL